jgi:hypothetical protein
MHFRCVITCPIADASNQSDHQMKPSTTQNHLSNPTSSSAAAINVERKPYRAPRLKTVGTVAELTASLGGADLDGLGGSVPN